MVNGSPSLLASSQAFHWTLQADLAFDFFGFEKEGSAALLLLGMHLTDPMPWLCARNPVHCPEGPGQIDLESKRILGKRFRVEEKDRDPVSVRTLNPLALVLSWTERAGHDFELAALPPVLEKTPGKLLPRRLTATAQFSFGSRSITLHSRNFSELSQCLHAELTLIFAISRYLAQCPDPPQQLDDFQLATTLKPCKMCAAFLHQVRSRCLSFRVRYDEDDPGRLAANTLLDQYGYASSRAISTL